MKFVLTAISAGIIATAMLSNPAAARPRCGWEGHHWRCWNGHSSYNDHHAWHHGYYGRRGHDMHYGNSGPYGHGYRGEVHYGR